MKSIILTSILIFGSITASANDIRKKIFTDIYVTNAWNDPDTRSGTGSSIFSTTAIRKNLPNLFKHLNIKILLDVPCGDCYWIRTMDLSAVNHYIGADIVPAMIDANKKQYGGATRTFICGDVVKDVFPQADLILCRDCLVHLSYQDALQAIQNFKKSGAKYLLATTFPRHGNTDIQTGGWRALNLEQAPFYFPAPIALINEECLKDGGYFSDKSLGLWCLDDLLINFPN